MNNRLKAALVTLLTVLVSVAAAARIGSAVLSHSYLILLALGAPGPSAIVPYGATVTLSPAFRFGTGMVKDGGSATVLASVISGNAYPVGPLSASQTYTLVVTNAAGDQATGSVTVTVTPPVVSNVNPATATLTVGGQATFTSSVSGALNTGINWAVDGVAGGNASVGTITAGGVYTAGSTTGAHTVKATAAADGVTNKTATVTVVAVPVATSLTASTITPPYGTTFTLTPVYAAGTGTIDNGVTCPATGVASAAVTANWVGARVFTLTVTNAAGTTATATTTVTPSIAVSAVTPASGMATGGIAKTFTATASGGTTNTLSWSVDGVVGGNATVGTITAGGVYTPPAANVSRTNLLCYSEQLQQASNWTKQTSVAVTADAAIAPDGSLTADLVNFTSSAVAKGVFNTAPGSFNGVMNTKSIWLKGFVGGEVVELTDPGWTAGIVTCNLTTSWQRFSLSESAPNTLGEAGVWIRKKTGNKLYAWGAQLEWGAAATGYIPTTTTAVATTNEVRLISATSTEDTTKWAATKVTVYAAPTSVLAATTTSPLRGATDVALTPFFTFATSAVVGTTPGNNNIASAPGNGNPFAVQAGGFVTATTYYLRATNAVGDYLDSSVTVTPQTVAVSAISPANPTKTVGTVTTFSAVTTGHVMTGVNWTASAGSINSSTGQWTAPGTPQSVTITATSQADGSKTSTTTVTVIAAPTGSLAASTMTPLYGSTNVTVTPTWSGAGGSCIVGTAQGASNISASATSGVALGVQPDGYFAATTYWLRAYNAVGDYVDSSVAVTPQAVSVSAITPANSTVAAGATQLLQAQSLGSEDPAVDWSVDGVRAGNSTVGTLTGANLVPDPTFSNAAGITVSGPSTWVLYNNAQATEPATITQFASGGVGNGSFVRVAWSVDTGWARGIYTSSANGNGISGGWKANTTYRVTWWARGTGTNAAGGGWMDLFWNTQPASMAAISMPILSTSWQRYERIITTGSTVEGSGAMFLGLGSSNNVGTLDITRVSVQEVGNLLVNADYSAGLYSGWGFAANNIPAGGLSTGLNNGVWAVAGVNTPYIRQVGTIGNPSAFCYFLSNAMPVTPGHTYSGMVYTGAHRCTGEVNLVWYDGANSPISAVFNSVAISQNTAEFSGGSNLDLYKLIRATGVAPVNAATVRFGVYKYDTYAGQADSYLFWALPKVEHVGGMATYTAPAAVSRTNILTYSQQLDNGVWVKGASGTGSTATVTANAGAAPDGTITADRLQCAQGTGATSSDWSLAIQTTGVAADNVTFYTLSLWAKSNTGSNQPLNIALTGQSQTLITVTPVWQRFSVSCAVQSSGGAVRADIGLRGPVTAANATSDVLLWGMQVETGSTPTGYIPTTSSSATSTSGQHIVVATSQDDATKSATTGVSSTP